MTGSSFFSRRELREISTELIEDERARRAARLDGRTGTGGCALLAARVAGQQLDDLLADAREIGAELHEDLGRDALTFADQPEEDVLGADVVVAELERLPQRELEDLLRGG